MNQHVRTLHATSTALAALSLATALPTFAQTGLEAVALEEITITAQKREESLQDVPLSVDALSGDKLAEAGIVRMDDLKAYVPNLQMTETGIANNIYIRGIGSGLNQGFEQSVSLYADGIYRGRGHQARMPFLDLERIEVLRGPQPILFGKNAVAGAVNMVSARPGDEFEGSVRAWYDFEQKEKIADLVLSGPLTDAFGARLAVRSRDSEGYVKNPTLNRDEPQREELGARLTLDFDAGGMFDATLRAEYGTFETLGRHMEIFGETPSVNPAFSGLTHSQIVGGGALPLIGRPNGLPTGTDATSRNNVIDYQRSSAGDSSELDTREISLTLNWDLGGGTVTSVSGYSGYKLDELCDCDFVAATVFNAGVREDYRQISQELRFTSAPDGTLPWIAGLYFQDYELDESDYLYVPPTSLVPTILGLNPGIGANAAVFANAANPRVFEQDSTQWSAFVQATFNVSDVFRITAGGRYSRESKTGRRTTLLTAGLGGPLINAAFYPLFANPAVLGILPHDIRGERDESNFSPLVNFQYDFGDDSMAYLSWARGSKAGGFDARSNKAPAAGGTFEFEDEQATTYELGVKSRIANVAELNAAVFFTDYKDLQTSAFDGAIGFNVGNGSAEVKGVELSGRWQATRGLQLSGSLAYLDFEWTNYIGQCEFDRRLLGAEQLQLCRLHQPAGARDSPACSAVSTPGC